MKKFVLLAGVALLAACSQKEDAAAPEAAATEAMPMDAGTASAAVADGIQPGKYDVVDPDGKAMVTEVMADGTYQDWTDGKVTEKGTVAVKDGKTCFDPEGDEGETCFADSTPAADGSFTATGPKGEVFKVKPQA
jgi:hypothetical protein